MPRTTDFITRYSAIDMRGKNIIVTGANSGIGYEAARVLSLTGAKIFMACRSTEKGEAAKQKIMASNPASNLEVLKLDLADLSSVKSFINYYNERVGKCNILINNAGVMATPRGRTADGFETQFGTNHIGHFVLTAGILPGMLDLDGSRVVNITSIAHFRGSINFNDLQANNGYNRMVAYRQSKLANLLFSYELDRRLKSGGHKTISVAVHPGITSTNIVKLPKFLEIVKETVLMDTVKGALPTIMGAVDPVIGGGEYIGPDGLKQAFGFPAILKSGGHSYDEELAVRLWQVSEELTGIKYEL